MTSWRLGGSSPSTICRSVRQTPHARTCSKTWVGGGLGRGLSEIFSGRVKMSAGALNTTAFMGMHTQNNRWTASSEMGSVRALRLTGAVHSRDGASSVWAQQAMIPSGPSTPARQYRQFPKRKLLWTDRKPPCAFFPISCKSDNKPSGVQFIKERNPKRGSSVTGS
jgi:hypothetical protein